jgi:hypothetical protein
LISWRISWVILFLLNSLEHNIITSGLLVSTTKAKSANLVTYGIDFGALGY